MKYARQLVSLSVTFSLLSAGACIAQLVTVFLSPYLSQALRLPSASLWKMFWPDACSTSCPQN